jgi:LacI family transcriptional regulator
MKRTTIRDVAREAGVGLMTVSRVLNDSKNVTQKTERRVRAAILRVGYRPNEAARMLKGRASKTIGLLVPYLDDFFGDYFHAVQEVAASEGYMTLVGASERKGTQELNQAKEMMSRSVAGLLVATSNATSDPYGEAEFAGFPIVAFDRPLNCPGVDSVLAENRNGTREAVEHLIGHGHKNILCIGFDAKAYTVQERITGYIDAMRSAKLKPEVHGDLETAESIKQLIAHKWQSKRRPTAIFAMQYLSSVNTVNAVMQQGLQIPKDIALIGFDDFNLARALHSPLTTVAQPVEEIGRRSAEMLFRRLRNENEGEQAATRGTKIMFPTHLVIRNSCGCK